VLTPIESRFPTPENPSPTRHPVAGASLRRIFVLPPSGVLHMALDRRQHNGRGARSHRQTSASENQSQQI